MLTPQEKAVELYSQYEQLGRDFTRGVSMKQFAKECALIAVDEILNIGCIEVPYWQEVKAEIEKL
jgi:hypothetical protein